MLSLLGCRGMSGRGYGRGYGVLAVLGACAAVVMGFAGRAGANVPPNAPVITEPATDGRILNAEDVHMETGPFSDPDPADTHVCSDFEIWLVNGTGVLTERVWLASCKTGVERVHVHLGDGVFQGSYAGRTSLRPSVSFRLRARHRDSSGDAATEWSAFTERPFSTAAATAVSPLTADDVALTPAPTLLDTLNAPLVLPGGATPASLRVESGASVLLLEVRGVNGVVNQITNPAALTAHQALRVRAVAGTLPYAQPAANLTFTDGTGIARKVYLPAFSLGAGQAAVYWVSLGGATYTGTAVQTTPDFSSLARGAPVPWTLRSQGYAVDVFAAGFQLPVNIAFVPSPGPDPTDPYMYVTELYGSIKLVTRGGTISTYVSGLLNFNPTGAFPGSGEQGVAGVAVEPGTGDLIVTMVYDSAPPNGAHYPKVVRFHSTDGGRTAASQAILLDMPGEIMGASHQVSNVTFGPDGKLYVHVGDGFDATQGQNTASFRGKVLRINPDGSAPLDNPFYSVVNGITATDYIYAYGLRNPFGGAWRGSDSTHYTVENGPSVDRLSKLVRGRNYLYDGSDASMMNFALYNWNPAAAPVNIAFIQPQTFGGSGFPATMYGRAFISESGATYATGPQSIGKRISSVLIDATGGTAGAPVSFLEYNGSGKATCSAIAAGPDGLYYSDLYKDLGATSPIDAGANILRVRFLGDAAFVATPTVSDTAPLTVSFTDSSTVPGATAWAWSFGDGATAAGPSTSHTYTAPGVYTVRLSVTGSAGSAVSQRNGLVRIGQLKKIAVIGVSLPPPAGDLAIANYLATLGYEVVNLDDEPGNRPNASQIASDYGLVMVSSTVNSGNIAGEFRSAAVPMIFWEGSLLTTTREALASATTTQGGQTQITVVNNTHPVMQGQSLGNVTVFTSGQTLSLATGTISSGATILANGVGGAAPAILVAEEGAPLLNAYFAPARRVFLYYSDTSFTVANAAGKAILSNAVCWTMRLAPVITGQPAAQTVAPGGTATFAVSSTGHPQRTYQWRKGGVPLVNGGQVGGANSAVLTITGVQVGDAGAYDVVISTPTCGGATSVAASLTVGTPCAADFNHSGGVTVQDIFDFLSAYFANDPSADFNVSGGVTVQDIFDFLGAYFTGCN